MDHHLPSSPPTASTFGAVTRGAEIVATRWTPLIARNLLLGCDTFSELREASPGVSRTLLTQRLRMLEHHGILDRRVGSGRRVRYQLAPAGLALAPVIDALSEWAETWIEGAPPHPVADRALRDLCAALGPDDLLSEGRHVIRIDTEAAGRRETTWLLLHRGAAEVCRRPPADVDDLVLQASAATLARWLLGEFSLGQALAAGTIRVDGPRWLERLIAGWGGQVGRQGPGVARSAPLRAAAVVT